MEQLQDLGVVLCGGNSRRMGTDKAVLEVGGQRMLARAVDVLGRVAGRVVLACGADERYDDLGLERVYDTRDDAGPLAGLEAGLRAARDSGAEWVFALACDMPRAVPAVLRALHRTAREQDADACLLRTAGGLEPLLAVYRTGCLAAVTAALDTGERRMTSFHGRPGAARIEVLPEAELGASLAAKDCARNLNTPSELAHELEDAG
jgi:molybdopterin-guanine dinucleotide biosynthesis protein A